MQRRSKAVVYLGMTYPHGIIRHFALLAVEMQRLVERQSSFDLYFASTDGETNQNAWPMIEGVFPRERIIKTHAFENLVDRICALTDQYDRVIVHTGGGWGQTKFFIKAKKMRRLASLRIRLVGTTHSYRNDSWMRIPMSAFQCCLYWFFYRMIVFQCQDAADRFLGGNWLIRKGLGTVIPLGCEPFVNVGVASIPLGLQQSGLSEILQDANLFKFVYLAQFRPGKMHKWLVETLAPVLKKNSSARLILCGMGNSEVIDLVKKTVRALGIESQVVVPGQVRRDEVPWLLAHVNCAIVPSRAETFGHNFLEPMFAGLPVLGTRVGIGKEIVKDGETGFGFSLNNKSELQEAAAYLIAHREEAVKMGGRAKKYVSFRYRHSDVAGRMVELYRKLLDER